MSTPLLRRERARPASIGVTVAVTLAGLAVLAVLAPASLALGSHMLPLSVTCDALLSYDARLPEHVIVHDLRLPRTAVGILVGAALGVAGVLMQAVTRNPLAEPGLLGINSGAAVVVAAGLVVAPGATATQTVLFAFVGAALAGVAVLVLGGAFRQTVDPVRLVLAGAALSVVLGALTSALVLAYRSVFESFRYWDAGAIAPRPWSLIAALATCLALGLLLGAIAAPALDALALGAEMGRAMGASPLRAWSLSGVAVVLLAGAATAAAGPIAFVGLAAPMIARGIVGPSVGRLLVVSCVFGADALLAADLLGRVVAPPREVQASVICAFVGAPIFIAFARRRRLVKL